MKKLYLVFIFGVMLFSCSQHKSSKNNNNIALSDSLQSLNQHIMHIHDDAMQYNAYVLKLKRLINQQIDSAALQTVSVDTLRAISAKLYMADRKMLDWMHGYKMPNASNDSAITYLIKQKALIDEVHVITFEAINDAEKALNLPTKIKPKTHEQ